MGDNKKYPVGKQLLTVALSAGMLVTQTAPIFADDASASDSSTKALDLMSKEVQGDASVSADKKAYADEDIVTLIVELETAPLANANAKARSSITDSILRKSLLAEHDFIRNAIRDEIAPKQRAAIVSEYDYTMVLNGFTMETEYGNLKKIEKIDGVKRVFVSEEQALVEPMMKNSSEMVDAPQAWASNYTGKGSKVAVLDTGLDTKHEAFQTTPKDVAYSESDIETLFNTKNFQAKKFASSTTANDVYYSAKVPYQFDYADKNVDVAPESDATAAAVDHGTHVAGTVAGYLADEEGTIRFSGIAPDAQLFIMKVFSDKGGGAYDSNILAALEDAMNLDVDTVNMSLGSGAGFSDARDAAMNDVYKRISDQGVDMMLSAGNDYDSARKTSPAQELYTTENPDRGIVGSPSTYPYSTSVASVNNTNITLPALSKDGRDIGYTTTAILMNSLIPAGQETASLPYVVIPNAGEPKDFEGKDVTGKLALIQRGTIAFTEKVKNAADHGAVGVIIFDNVDGAMTTMTSDGNTIAACFIKKVDGEFLRDAGDSEITIMKGEVSFDNNVANEMSDFSSLGTTPDLKIKPEITAPGGAIYSTVPVATGSYGTKDGTSMAAPHMAGMSAIMHQYMNENFADLGDVEERNLIDQILMSTASPVKQKTNGAFYSPRKQGAGLANINNALNTQAYISVAPDKDGNTRPKLELGDDANKSGLYYMNFTVNNMSDEAQTYTTELSVLIDGIIADGENNYISKKADALELDKDYYVSGVNSSDTRDVSVAANSSKEVSLMVMLTPEGKKKLDAFEHGDFVEGYIQLKPKNGVNNDISLSIPYLAFYGNWAEAPILEETKWYDNTDSYVTYPLEMTAKFGANDILLGGNHIDKSMGFNPDTFAISPDGNQYGDYINAINFGMLRGARKVTYKVVNADGNTVYEQSTDHMRKSIYNADYDMKFPETAYTGDYPIKHFKGKDDKGNVLPDGQYTYIIKADVDYNNPDSNTRNTYEVPLKIDTKAPVGSGVKVIKRDGRLFLTGHLADENAVMSVGLINNKNNSIFAHESYDDGRNAVDFEFDVTDYEGQTVTLYGVDFGYNEQDYSVEIKAPAMEDTATAKAVLGAAITKAQSLNKDELLVNVNKKVVKHFRACLDEAVKVYADQNATNEKLTGAWKNLADAMQYLDFTANTAELEALLAEWADADMSRYVEDENLAEFYNAQAHAEDVLGNENSLDASLTEAFDRMTTAISNLVLKDDEFDTIALDYMIAKSDLVIKNEAKYDTKASSWATFMDAYNKAVDARKANASQDAMDAAAIALASAYEDVRLIANEDTLNELKGYVVMIDEINVEEYRTETMVYFMNARAMFQNMINQESYTMQEYEDAASLAKAVEDKIANDKMVIEDSAKPNTPSEEPAASEEPFAPASKETPKTSAITKGTTKPSTGDTTRTGVVAGSMVTAGIAAAFAFFKRRKK